VPPLATSKRNVWFADLNKRNELMQFTKPHQSCLSI
jgi:hypothetical protein